MLEGIGERYHPRGAGRDARSDRQNVREKSMADTRKMHRHISARFSMWRIMKWLWRKILHFIPLVSNYLLPFYGKAHIAYIPDGKVVGLSKLARTVEVFAKRLQLQEQLTGQIADALMEYLQPKGVMVMGRG